MDIDHPKAIPLAAFFSFFLAVSRWLFRISAPRHRERIALPHLSIFSPPVSPKFHYLLKNRRQNETFSVLAVFIVTGARFYASVLVGIGPPIVFPRRYAGKSGFIEDKICVTTSDNGSDSVCLVFW